MSHPPSRLIRLLLVAWLIFSWLGFSNRCPLTTLWNARLAFAEQSNCCGSALGDRGSAPSEKGQPGKPECCLKIQIVAEKTGDWVGKGLGIEDGERFSGTPSGLAGAQFAVTSWIDSLWESADWQWMAGLEAWTASSEACGDFVEARSVGFGKANGAGGAGVNGQKSARSHAPPSRLV